MIVWESYLHIPLNFLNELTDIEPMKLNRMDDPS